MKKLTKVLAAMMIMCATMFVVGCERENDQPILEDWVDLGLPSGLLWATHNVGAAVPTGFGFHFAWGETRTKSDFGYGNYRYGTYDRYHFIYNLTKYCSNPSYSVTGFTDTLTILQPEDDAATVNWGDGARTPTKAEWQELLDNTTVTNAVINSVFGLQFTGSNGVSIFLPAAEFGHESYMSHIENCGAYWSSSLNTDAPSSAWILSFNVVGQFAISTDSRGNGLSVRAVRSAR